MKRLQSLHGAHAFAQRVERDTHSLDGLGELLTTADAAARLLYTGPRAIKNFFAWADRNRVPRLHRGSRVLWQAHVLAAFLKRDKWTQKRVAVLGHKAEVTRAHPRCER